MKKHLVEPLAAAIDNEVRAVGIYEHDGRFAKAFKDTTSTKAMRAIALCPVYYPA